MKEKKNGKEKEREKKDRKREGERRYRKVPSVLLVGAIRKSEIKSNICAVCFHS